MSLLEAPLGPPPLEPSPLTRTAAQTLSAQLAERFAQRIRDNVARMDWLAAEILQRARAAHPQIDDCGLAALLADAPAAETSLAPIWYAAA